MSLFENRYYQICSFLLTIIGHWPYQKTGEKIFFRVVGFTTLITGLLPSMACVYTTTDIGAKSDSLSPLFVILTAIGKSVVYTCKQKKLLEILECIKSDWKLWSSGPEFEILKKYAERGRSICILFSGNTLLILITLLLVPLSPIILDKIIPLNESRSKVLVYPVEFFVDQDKYLKWLLLYGWVTTVYYATFILACHSMYAIGTQHACGLFAILSYRLKNAIISENDFCFEADKNKYNNEEEMYQYMAFAIERHNYAIRYIKILESCFSPCFFIEIGFNMIQTSVLGFQMVLSLDQEISRTIKYGGLTLGMIFHIYLLSLPSQKMTDQIIAVARNVYDGRWYYLPIKSRKLLRMIIIHGSIPYAITALKFWPLNMVTYCTVLKTCFSYFTVLSSLRN